MRRKGFYFSFDAVLALTVMAGSLMIVAQSGQITTGDFQTNTVNYESTNLAGKDAMKLSSIETFRSFEPSFQDELRDQTVMEQDDMNRTILDGISLLWAARNLTYAEEAAQRYYDSKLPDEYGYRLQINESGAGNVIYETGGIPGDARVISSVSRLVSGHRIDQPSEGVQARARATEATTNITRVIQIPMMGSATDSNEMLLEKKFDINADRIHNATIYFSTQWGQSNFNSNEVLINGDEVNVGGSSESDWMYYEDKGGAQIGFDRADVTEEVQTGWNTFNLEFNNQDDDVHARIQPGTRIKVTYSTDGGIPDNEYSYFTDIESTASNLNQRGGVWYTHPMYLPGEATVEDATLDLEIRNLRDDPDYTDLKVFLNRDLIHAENVSGDVSREINLEGSLQEGNNVLSVYGNVRVEDGEVVDFTGYDENPRIYSDPENDPEGSTRVHFDYSMPEGDELEYGEIEVSVSEPIGGSPSNPKEFDRLFDDVNVSRAFINLAQMDNQNLTVEAGHDGLETVFQSPRDYATPSRIEIDTDRIEEGEENDFRLEDECTVYCYFLPESGLQIYASVPNQVGYGELFPNQSAATDDAVERLRDRMGEYADATGIETSEVATGGQPYIWGPASVKLVVWRE